MLLNLIAAPQNCCEFKTSGMILNCELSLSIILLYGQSPDLHILDFIQIRNIFIIGL